MFGRQCDAGAIRGEVKVRCDERRRAVRNYTVNTVPTTVIRITHACDCNPMQTLATHYRRLHSLFILVALSLGRNSTKEPSWAT